jgi:hypothetical protein
MGSLAYNWLEINMKNGQICAKLEPMSPFSTNSYKDYLLGMNPSSVIKSYGISKDPETKELYNCNGFCGKWLNIMVRSFGIVNEFTRRDWSIEIFIQET